MIFFIQFLMEESVSWYYDVVMRCKCGGADADDKNGNDDDDEMC